MKCGVLFFADIQVLEHIYNMNNNNIKPYTNEEENNCKTEKHGEDKR